MKGLWTYRDYLPTIPTEYQLSMGEGHTPLIKSRYLGEKYGIPNLYFKLENLNPTGSYKDRFAAMAISDMLQAKAKICLATSSGNTGAALAAYAARAGLPCFIAVVDGAPQSKVNQMQVYGAKTFTPSDFGLDVQVTKEVFDHLEILALEYGCMVQISAFHYCPTGMVGVQTIAYELAEQLPEAGHVFTPSGGGGLCLAVAKGYLQLKNNQASCKLLPRVHCVQPVGNDTIAGALRKGKSQSKSIEKSTTTISGLQVPNVIDGHQVISSLRKMDGQGYLVKDEAVFELQKLLAQKEGIFCEPAAAVSLAGAMSAAKMNEINREDKVVCLITGHGFKDEKSAYQMIHEYATPRLTKASNIKHFINEELQKKEIYEE